MANRNLFEEYGIKEVADVTFYRIEKKEETYESQREISAASILKGAVELRTVYPLINELGAEEGFEAYVFSDAEILTGTNYDCDDSVELIANLRINYSADNSIADPETDSITKIKDNAESLVSWAITGNYNGNNIYDLTNNFEKPVAISYINVGTGMEMPLNKVTLLDNIILSGENSDNIVTDIISEKNLTESVSREVTVSQNDNGSIIVTPGTDVVITQFIVDGNRVTSDFSITHPTQAIQIQPKEDAAVGVTNFTITFSAEQNGSSSFTKTFSGEITEVDNSKKITTSTSKITATVKKTTGWSGIINVSIPFTGENSRDTTTGIYKENDKKVMDAAYEDGVGTHEYSYDQQICMLFAKKQNLITKTGARYKFTGTDSLFGDIEFNDEFAGAPNSEEKIVVVGISGKFTEGTYDTEEVNTYIKNITTTFNAKAYDVTYKDYAELVVEDEMGFYRKDFLGYEFNRSTNNGEATITAFTDANTYSNWILANGKSKDSAIANAVMWEDGVHYSINDAISALRQKQLTLDVSETNKNNIGNVFGGYKVSSKDTSLTNTPDVGNEDIPVDGYPNNTYDYDYNGRAKEYSSNYPLSDVKETIEEIIYSGNVSGNDIKVDSKYTTSNRAIYIKVDAADTAAGAYIYLLHNKNSRRLSTDKEGIFQFEDKKGNTLYYQDKIFKGIEYLALVIIGNKGLIFVVNRHGNVDVSRVAWMVNENGYITDKKAEAVVKNGLIHTTDITVKDETFEATCTVKSLKVRKITKKTNHYTPVLFLDTLKVSTLEQSAEEVFATGGKGNAKLIGWDYGKEITLSLQDALFTPASMSAIFGSYEGNDFTKGVKEVKTLDNFKKYTAKRSFIVPAGNSNGTPTEADKSAQAVFYDPNTMQPYPDGTPIAEGEEFLKFTRSVAYKGQSLGHMIEISANKFPGTYKIVGDTFARSKDTGEDERFQFVIPQAKMQSNQTITLEAEGEPTVFDMNMTVLRPDDGVMVRFIQYNVIENEEQNDGSDMVKDTENLNLLDDAELFKVSAQGADDIDSIGATEY